MKVIVLKIVVSCSKMLALIVRAADWKLDAPDWSGRMRITAKGKVAYIKLEDKVSGMASLFTTLQPALSFLFYFLLEVRLRLPVM